MCDMDSTLKFCYRCKTNKQKTDFRKNRAKPDGLATECRVCASRADKERYARNAELERTKRKAHYEANKQDYVRRAVEWAKRNPEKDKARRAKYSEQNREAIRAKYRAMSAELREEKRRRLRDWRKRNPEKSLEQVRKRQVCKLRAMPAWADRAQIKAIYAEARRVSEATGVKHHVDHFYPLRGELVCGLHVPANLRIVPAYVNQSKGAKMPETLLEQTECPLSLSSLSTTASGSAVATPFRTAGPSRPSSACRCAA